MWPVCQRFRRAREDPQWPVRFIPFPPRDSRSRRWDSRPRRSAGSGPSPKPGAHGVLTVWVAFCRWPHVLEVFLTFHIVSEGPCAGDGQAVGPLPGWKRLLAPFDLAVCAVHLPPGVLGRRRRNGSEGLREALRPRRSVGVLGAGAQDSTSGFGFAPSLRFQGRAGDTRAVVCLFIFHLINAY